MKTSDQTMTSLADIDTRIGVFPDAMPRYGTIVARKAIWRVSDAAGTSPSDVPAEKALTDYEALRGTVGQSLFYDERLYLRRALELPKLPRDVAQRIRESEQTFADAVLVIRLQPWGKECGRVAGALSSLARKLGSETHRIPASLAFVDEKLQGLTHSDFALAPRSFEAFCTRARRGVRLVDMNARRRLSKSLLVGPWRGLVELVGGASKSGGDMAKLWPLVEYCYRHGIAPDGVSDETVAALRADLERRGRKGAFALVRDVVYAWERLQRRVSGFPGQTLARLYRPNGNTPHAVPFKNLPEPFRRDWQAYAEGFFAQSGSEPASLADLVSDPADPAAAFRAALDRRVRGGSDRRSARALPTMRTIITYAANTALTRARAAESVKDLLTADILTAVLEAMIERRRKRYPDLKSDELHKCSTHRNTASLYISMGRDFGVDAVEISRMIEILDTVDPHMIGVRRRGDGSLYRRWSKERMGPRHRERLRQFNDPVKLLSWFDVRNTLLDRARELVKRGRRPLLEDVNDMIVCVLHFITRVCPARRINLAELRLSGPGRNVFLPSRAKAKGHIHIDWHETKNKEPHHAELPDDAVQAIELYLRHFRPVLAAAAGADVENPYLFPACGANHRDAGLLNKAFVERNWAVGGVRLNLHCQRHLCAKLVLDQDPGQMELVRIILAHRNIETTKSYYAEINQILAQRRYHELLEQRERELRAGTRATRGR